MTTCCSRNRERGKRSFDRNMNTLDDLRKGSDAATKIRKLRDTALADKQYETLHKGLN